MIYLRTLQSDDYLESGGIVTREQKKRHDKGLQLIIGMAYCLRKLEYDKVKDKVKHTHKIIIEDRRGDKLDEPFLQGIDDGITYILNIDLYLNWQEEIKKNIHIFLSEDFEKYWLASNFLDKKGKFSKYKI